MFGTDRMGAQRPSAMPLWKAAGLCETFARIMQDILKTLMEIRKS